MKAEVENQEKLCHKFCGVYYYYIFLRIFGPLMVYYTVYSQIAEQILYNRWCLSPASVALENRFRASSEGMYMADGTHAITSNSRNDVRRL